MEPPYILETKRIHIQGYPEAFNPCIVKWNDRLLMSFRARDPITKTANLIGFTWLDAKFNPVGKPELLTFQDGVYMQDPRLVVIGQKLFMAYSDLKNQKRKMCMAEILHDGVRFFAVDPDCYLDYDGDPENKFEKNWVPFDYQGQMLLSYSLSPHKVFLPIHGENRCITLETNQDTNTWAWGTLRGGTPALLVDNHYLAFFHSSIPLATVQSDGKSMFHYFMGAYIFEKKPPFAIKKISPYPLIHKDFYNGTAYQTWKPLRVIFPCGYIHNDKYIWISYGRQDNEAWIVKLDKAGLYESLVPFNE